MEEDEQRILCPSCQSDLVQPRDGPFSDVFIYATPQQMRERHLTCDNFSCPIYIEGQPQLHDWVAKDEDSGDQHLQPTSQDENDKCDNNHLIVAGVDNDPDTGTSAFVIDQAIANYDNQLQHAEIDGLWAPHSNVIFVPATETLSPFDITAPSITSPDPLRGATPDSAISQGYSGFPSPAGNGYPVPVAVYSPVRAPSTLPDTNSSPSPVPTGAASESPSRQNSAPTQKPRAAIRNRYTEYEIDVILQMKAQGHGNDKIAQVLPRHTARSIEAKFAALTKGRPRQGS